MALWGTQSHLAQLPLWEFCGDFSFKARGGKMTDQELSMDHEVQVKVKLADRCKWHRMAHTCEMTKEDATWFMNWFLENIDDEVEVRVHRIGGDDEGNT
jgi:hypothetical protein